MTGNDGFKAVKIILLIILLVFVAGAFMVVMSELSVQKNGELVSESASKPLTTSERIESHEMNSLVPVEEREEEFSRGEAGDDSQRYSDNQMIVKPFETERPRARTVLTELALEYDGVIPYASGGRSFDKGFHKYASGIDNRGKAPELQTGLDSWGYVVWLFKNVFGALDEAWLEPESLVSTGKTVNKEEIRVGDIGMMYPAGKVPNHYGVCIGFSGNKPVFSHCVNIPKEHYPLGCTRLSFLAADSQEYIDMSGPVSFTVFFRPDLNWED